MAAAVLGAGQVVLRRLRVAPVQRHCRRDAAQWHTPWAAAKATRRALHGRFVRVRESCESCSRQLQLPDNKIICHTHTARGTKHHPQASSGGLTLAIGLLPQSRTPCSAATPSTASSSSGGCHLVGDPSPEAHR